MKIETKYDLGQTVWCVVPARDEQGGYTDHEVTTCVVKTITVYIGHDRVSQSYTVATEGSGLPWVLNEKDCFPNIAEAQTERDRRDWGKK